MNKKQLHMALRTLKKELQNVYTITDLIKLSLKGHELTTELFKKGISTTDIKIMLSWNVAKDKRRSEILRKGVA